MREPDLSSGICDQIDPELWFPEKGQSPRRAKAMCRRCPITSRCLEWALETGVHGVWGATTERERRALRKTRAA